MNFTDPKKWASDVHKYKHLSIAQARALLKKHAELAATVDSNRAKVDMQITRGTVSGRFCSQKPYGAAMPKESTAKVASTEKQSSISMVINKEPDE